MREIIFRGKRKDNGEWVCGDLIHWWGRHNTKPDIQIYNNIQRFNVIPESVSEFTGLTDKNGKKIFEGDVVKYKNTDGIKFNGVALTVIGKVVYNEKNASFAISGKDEIGAKHYDYFPIKNIEIVGNIHDNPELLGEE